MPVCGRIGCHREGVNRCSICLREPYCCCECQKSDWKKHKLVCKILKKLSSDRQSYNVVIQTVTEIFLMPKNVRVLNHLLHYVEFQVGKRRQIISSDGN